MSLTNGRILFKNKKEPLNASKPSQLQGNKKAVSHLLTTFVQQKHQRRLRCITDGTFDVWLSPFLLNKKKKNTTISLKYCVSWCRFVTCQGINFFGLIPSLVAFTVTIFTHGHGVDMKFSWFSIATAQVSTSQERYTVTKPKNRQVDL